MVWSRQVDGQVLHFYLAGINDENFLMRDRETGTWWQQVTGEAIAGPLRGTRLRLLSSEEISFGLWRREYPWGSVLAPVAADRKNYVRAGWVQRYHKYPVVVPVPKGPLRGRTLVVGVAVRGASRAYPLAQVVKQGVIEDTLGGLPILVAAGPDQRTVRVFIRQAPGLTADADFFKEVAAGPPAGAKLAGVPVKAQAAASGAAARTGQAATEKRNVKKPGAKKAPPYKLAPWTLMDAATGSQWNFRGCAIQGKEKGQCLPVLPSLSEDWFDWRHYHPASQVWSVGLRR